MRNLFLWLVVYIPAFFNIVMYILYFMGVFDIFIANRGIDLSECLIK